MTLKTRFAVTLVFHTVLVLAIFAGTYYIRERRAAESKQREQQQQVLAVLAAQCAGVRLTANPIAALNHVQLLTKEPSIRSAACLDPQGRVEIHSDPGIIGKLVADGSMDQTAEETRSFRHQAGSATELVWRQPLAKRQGWAEIRFDADLLARRINEDLWATLNQLIRVSSTTLVLALIIAVGFGWSLSRPIGRLVSGVRAIGGGNLEYQAPEEARSDELGLLAREVNLMAKKLKQLDELKDDFIANVSHDLRSPMAAIKMYADYMLNIDPASKELKDGQKSSLNIIMYNAIRLSVFVTNILDAAKMKAGQLQIAVGPVNAANVVRNTGLLFKALAESQKIGFAISVPEGLPPVLADPNQLDQVIANIVSNAMKFTPPGGRIEVAARQENGSVRISVKDTGAGIAPEDLKNLFQRFRQIEANQSRLVKGTGLGLFITKSTVDAMGGSISVESEVGKGSTFTLSFPIAPGGGNNA